MQRLRKTIRAPLICHRSRIETPPAAVSGAPIGDRVLRPRRGSLMIEMVVCTVLLSVVTTVLVPGIYAVHRQRKAARYDTFTLIELNNLAATATARNTETLKLSRWFSDRYPDTTLQVTKVEYTGDAAADTTADAAAKAVNDRSTPLRLMIVRATQDGLPDVQRSLVVWKPAQPTTSKGDAE